MFTGDDKSYSDVPLSYSQEDIELMIRQMFISAGPSTAVQPLVTGAQQGTVARGNSCRRT